MSNLVRCQVQVLEASESLEHTHVANIIVGQVEHFDVDALSYLVQIVDTFTHLTHAEEK